MGCDSCGTKKPGGCKSNGSCGTGSCNRLNVHDWLMNLPISDAGSSCKVVELTFNQGSRKDYYRNASLQFFEKGDLVAIEGTSGFDVGEVSLTGELVRLQLKKKNISEFDPEMKKILRPATDRDIDIWKQNKSREKDALITSRVIARKLNLQMKLSEIEIQADGRKATFFYTADDRIDFRELIKLLAAEFKVKVEMRQIGIRQEAAKVGGIGSCGRELCCSTWLNDFKSVTTTAARYQNLSINQTKLSGQCGRLKCCLNYELDTYLDAIQHFPDNADMLYTTKGTANLIKKDIFRNLMWYSLPDSSKHYPVTIKRVKEIQAMNRRNERPDELQAVEITNNKVKESDTAFVELVGHISLKSLEKGSRKRRDNDRQQNRRQGPPPPQQNQRPPQQNNQKPPQQQNQRSQQQNQKPPQQQNQRPPQRPQQNQGRPPQRQGPKPPAPKKPE